MSYATLVFDITSKTDGSRYTGETYLIQARKTNGESEMRTILLDNGQGYIDIDLSVFYQVKYYHNDGFLDSATLSPGLHYFPIQITYKDAYFNSNPPITPPIIPVSSFGLVPILIAIVIMLWLVI